MSYISTYVSTTEAHAHISIYIFTCMCTCIYDSLCIYALTFALWGLACHATEAEHDERVKTRSEELVALSETIKILNELSESTLNMPRSYACPNCK